MGHIWSNNNVILYKFEHKQPNDRLYCARQIQQFDDTTYFWVYNTYYVCLREGNIVHPLPQTHPLQKKNK